MDGRGCGDANELLSCSSVGGGDDDNADGDDFLHVWRVNRRFLPILVLVPLKNGDEGYEWWTRR